jgi:hypothetical protein
LVWFRGETEARPDEGEEWVREQGREGGRKGRQESKEDGAREAEIKGDM